MLLPTQLLLLKFSRLLKELLLPADNWLWPLLILPPEEQWLPEGVANDEV